MGGDDEFDDFLRKRRRLFGPAPDDELEPPAEIDRLVLRRARDAIEAPRAQRMFRAPPWSLPVTLAATLVLAFTVILHTARTPTKAEVASVSVEKVSRRLEAETAPATAAAPAPAAPHAAEPAATAAASAADSARSSAAASPEASGGAVVVDLARDRSLASEREAQHPVPPSGASSSPAAAQKSAPDAPWRRDSKTWIAEIEKLRASGDAARANAELAEFKRTYGAYAGAPDR